MNNKMKTKPKKNIRKQREDVLKKLLISKNFTIKDLKVEVLLMVTGMLISNYLKSYDDKSITLLSKSIDEETSKSNYDKLKKFYISITETVMTPDQLTEIIANADKDIISKKLALFTEPIGYFYNIAATRLQTKIMDQNKNNKTIKWVPEYIALSILYDLKEKNYTFSKFPKIENFNFEDIMQQFREIDLELKKDSNLSIFDKNNRTILNKMSDVSLAVIESLDKAKYDFK